MLRISVVVPTYQRPEALRRCLAGLARQTFPAAHFEVIVVDDGSRADPAAALGGEVFPFVLHLLRQANQGPASARNRGIAQARGAWVAFTDDDCVPAPDWLEQLWAQKPEDPAAAGVGGHTVRLEEHVYGRYIDWFGSLQPGQKPDGTVMYVVTCNALLRKAAVEAVGGFDTRVAWAGGEEPILGAALRQAGYRMQLAPRAQVYHQHPASVRGIFRMYVRYGRGEKAGSQLQARQGYSGNLPYFIKLFFLDNWRILTEKSLSWRDRLRFCFLTLIKALGNVWGWLRQGDILAGASAAASASHSPVFLQSKSE